MLMITNMVIFNTNSALIHNYYSVKSILKSFVLRFTHSHSFFFRTEFLKEQVGRLIQITEEVDTIDALSGTFIVNYKFIILNPETRFINQI